MMRVTEKSDCVAHLVNKQGLVEEEITIFSWIFQEVLSLKKKSIRSDVLQTSFLEGL